MPGARRRRTGVARSCGCASAASSPSFLWRANNGLAISRRGRRAPCEVHRYDPAGARKQFLPATCWRKADGEPEWRWKSIPSPRPLYGLDRLSESGAPVIVTEGEKAADAVSRIFQKSVCVTSLGGSQAARKTDLDAAHWT